MVPSQAALDSSTTSLKEEIDGIVSVVQADVLETRTRYDASHNLSDVLTPDLKDEKPNFSVFEGGMMQTFLSVYSI